MLNYLAGQWLSDEEATINVKNTGILTGISVYEVLRTYNGLPFAAKKHFERLKKSADYMGIPLPINFDEFLELLLEGVKKNHNSSGEELRIKVILVQSTNNFSEIIVLYEELPKVSSDVYELGVKVGISKFIRPSAALVPSIIKIPGAPWKVLTRKAMGVYYDMLLLNEKGDLCEGTISNVFLIKDEKLITPNIESGILPGITRENVIGLAKAMEIPVEERTVKGWELFTAQEVFLTHTSAGIVPIRKIEDRVYIEDFADGITRILLDNFEGFIMTNESNWEGLSK
ncbi:MULTISPECIES: aminotransferase class IV [Kosmotoga]|uniref:Aminotransferase class IV n=2 Tax=Kosmotoga TaxID=651456 RepID=C5CDJ0_KOSOT|nr:MULTISPECIES: aminotransferase class IV [Kosmotoga]ACR79074.1 aminotransferase class IV [Kosmotoga olearia TBF 19.5.1]MDK2953196.1 branched-chain amino acid aminotransferase [Kosmotoga sp.]OAA23776.1 aminotransferase class IV [Kosmotoga sp. DU53]